MQVCTSAWKKSLYLSSIKANKTDVKDLLPTGHNRILQNWNRPVHRFHDGDLCGRMHFGYKHNRTCLIWVPKLYSRLTFQIIEVARLNRTLLHEFWFLWHQINFVPERDYKTLQIICLRKKYWKPYKSYTPDRDQLENIHFYFSLLHTSTLCYVTVHTEEDLLVLMSWLWFGHPWSHHSAFQAVLCTL